MKRLALGLLGVLLLLLPAPARFQAQGEIALLSETYETRFPKEIVFILEARSEQAIKSITFTYQLGSLDSRHTGYPTFEPGQQVRAEYSLKTGGSSYIPPMTSITYSYLIEDAAGNRLSTPSQRILYEDGRFQWQKTEEGMVTLFWHDRRESSVRAILDVAVRTLKKMGEQAGAEVSRPIKLVLYNTKAEMDVALPPESETIRRELVTAGQAYAEYDLLLLLGAGTDIGDTVAHEVTHLVVDQAAGTSYGHIPDWLNEGLAVYAQSDAREYTRALDSAIRRDTLLRLKGMAGRPGRPDEVILFYGQAYSIVKYLVDSYGADKMRQLLLAFKESGDIEAALRKVYGLDLNGLERGWRAKIGASPPPAEAAPSVTEIPLPTLVPFGARPEGPPPAPQPSPATGGQGIPALYLGLGLLFLVALLALFLGILTLALRRAR